MAEATRGRAARHGGPGQEQAEVEVLSRRVGAAVVLVGGPCWCTSGSCVTGTCISFELRPAGGHTRLISRNRFDTAALPWKDKLAYQIIEPGSWVMERKILLTIKQRAERLARTPGST